MYLTIISIPFIGSFIVGIFGRKIGTTGSQILTTSCICITSILALISFFEVSLISSAVNVDMISWIDCEPLEVRWAFNFDDLTVSILIPVLVVSLIVHIYSISYIGEDPHTQRFFAYLSIFTAFIVVLVTGDSYFTLFIGLSTQPIYKPLNAEKNQISRKISSTIIRGLL